jgi:serine/threonine-protein kinase
MIEYKKLMDPNIVHFLRTRDYVFVKELGRGACGRTVLLRDDVLSQFFVCKKYSPLEGLDRQVLFQNFLREIKLLHDLNHANVVRVFNYHLYPDNLTGYIVMEQVVGSDLAEHLSSNPEQVNEVFEQVIDGFAHLESNKVLHRDIRHTNIMVSDDGVVKIIDLGFGKRVHTVDDFDKSISLNWWCDLPAEFEQSIYDFGTEVYFVGKLFEKLIQENSIDHFKYTNVLSLMCQRNPKDRVKSFADVQGSIVGDLFLEIDFSGDERRAYRYFADSVSERLVTLQHGKINQDIERLKTGLEAAYRTVMLEEFIPDAAVVLTLLLNGAYRYRKSGFPVGALQAFVRLLKTVSTEKQRILLSNLHTRLSAVAPYVEKAASGFDDMDDDIPF